MDLRWILTVAEWDEKSSPRLPSRGKENFQSQLRGSAEVELDLRIILRNQKCRNPKHFIFAFSSHR